MSKIKSPTTLSDTAKYHPYDPNLPIVFEEIKGIIQRELPDVQVEHIGSSSISGIGGKNVIDMVIPAKVPEDTSIKQHLYALGFQDSPSQHFTPMLVGSISYQGKDYKIILYITSEGSDAYKKWIAFRDYLRTHPKDAQAYDKVKRQTIMEAEEGGKRYQQAKTPFLLSIMEKIRMIDHGWAARESDA